MLVTQTQPSICTSCGHKLNKHSTGRENQAPRKGDLSVCMNCGMASQFDEELDLVPLTEEDLVHIQETDPAAFKALYEAVNYFKGKNQNHAGH